MNVMKREICESSSSHGDEYEAQSLLGDDDGGSMHLRNVG
jgi:hypothetical protein